MTGPSFPPRPAGVGFLTRLIVVLVLLLVIGYVGYLAITLGPNVGGLSIADFVRGEERILQPAELRGPPLRLARDGTDRVFLLTTQQERIVPLRFGRTGTPRPPRQMLHVDLWAFDVATARPAWKSRLRTYEGGGDIMFALLGADDGVLWAMVREPLAVSVRDGAIVADGERLEAANPPLAGKRVDEPGYVAFGAQGLQLTLSDSTQWVVEGASLKAQPRADAPTNRDGIVAPAYDASYSSSFQLRGLPINTMWLGVLTDEEAKMLQAPPVVPGAKPGDRPGVMADFLATQHVPGMLSVQPVPYRVWSAKVAKVSAAPRDWPKELPDNWGTRDQFSDYKALPESPPFLKAGLLGDGRSPIAYWCREPDSVMVLHHDKVGGAGRLRLARVSGPAGRVVWDAPLALANMDASMFGDRTLAFVGTEPNPDYDRDAEVSRDQLQKLVTLDVPSGTVTVYDLTAESVRDETPPVERAPTP